MDAERIVRDWQRPFYNLAYRMLGNEADASDATQEIFIQIFRGMKNYEPSREFRPWAYRIATNAILRMLRDRKLRDRKENEAAMERDSVDPQSAKLQAQRQEAEKLCQRKLAELPEDERSLLVLHYYQELPQTEIASTLDLPRTTVQSRLEKALGSLRKALSGAGLHAAVPEIEILLQSSASLPVPAKLAGSLATLASQAGTITTGLTIGGILVTKQLVLTAAAIGVLSLGIGFWAGGSLLGGKSQDGKIPDGQIVSKAEFDSLRALQEQTAARAASLEEEKRALIAAAASKREAIAAPALSEPETLAATPVAANASPTTKKDLDWSRLADLLSKNADLMVALFESPDESTLPQEDRDKTMEVYLEFSRMAQEARSLSEFPILDPEIAKGLASAVFEKTLGLSASQDEALQSIVERGLAQARFVTENPDALPTEIFLARTGLLDGIAQHFEDTLHGPQKDLWNKMGPVSQMLLQGNSTVCEIGMLHKDGSPSAQVASHWKKAFSLTPDQELTVQALAADFVQEGQSILARYNWKADSSSLGPGERAKIHREFLLAQINMEKRFAHLLTPAQRKKLSGRVPTVFRFIPDANMSTNVQSGPSF